MPYIKEFERDEPIDTTGRLTYHICMAIIQAEKDDDIKDDNVLRSILDGVLTQYLWDAHQECRVTTYRQINDWIGSLYCSLHELSRRKLINTYSQQQILTYIQTFYNEVVVPYEDQKIKENGDII
jgi:hypothetical protein